MGDEETSKTVLSDLTNVHFSYTVKKVLGAFLSWCAGGLRDKRYGKIFLPITLMLQAFGCDWLD